MNIATDEIKAIKMLTKLLKAAKKAQDEGKQMALSKIIEEANKLSYRLDSATEDLINFNSQIYVPVTGEIC